MYDFPTTPPPGTVRTTPDGASRVWDGVKWEAALGAVPPSDLSLYTVVAQNSTIARSLTNRFADRYSVEDWLTPGQPDGTTDNTAQLQAAINAAAGVTVADDTHWAAAPGNAVLLIPAAPNPYIVGTSLMIPSNSHIIIEHGATLKLAPQVNTHMFLLVKFAHHIMFELYGTLDGNSSQQYFKPTYTTFPPATDTPPSTISSGISNDTLWGGPTRNPIIQGGFCSHVIITGDRNGLITNFSNGTTGFSGCTHLDVSGISQTNSAFRAGSVGLGGWRNFPYAITGSLAGTPLVCTGTYVAATNLATITTTDPSTHAPSPHYMVPGEEFIIETPTSTAGGTPGVLMWHLFIALPGTAGSTLVFNAAGGGVNTTITSGRITNWFYKQADIVSGTYIPATGIITVTTTAPHQLVYGQVISSSVTGGTAATIATGIFELLDVTDGQSMLPISAGTKAVTLRYRAARTGITTTIVGSPSSTYNSTTGVVTLTTSTPHGMSTGDVATISLTGSGFLSSLNAEQLITSATSTTFTYQGPPGITGAPIPIITGGTVTGGPTQSITGGTIQLSTKAWNSGYDDCFMDQIRDIGPCIYGGGVNCYIRNSEITRNLGSGPYLFSDANSGRCVDCEISGNYIHDNYGAGVGTVNFGGFPRSSNYYNPHIGTRIFNNYITGNYGGAVFGNADGLEFTNNYLYANRVQALAVYGSVGEVVVGVGADRARITGNTIRDPCVLSTATHGSAVLQVASGTYNNATGAVSLTLVAKPRANDYLANLAYFTFSNSTSSPGGMSAALEGRYTTLAGTTGTTVNFTAPSGLGSFSITSGSVTPNGFGIVIHYANNCYIENNFIGDYQSTKTMLAAIGGTWGAGGVCTGNYFGPRINTSGNFSADMSAGGARGNNFDTVTGFKDGTTLVQPFSNDVAENFAPMGVQVGYNRSGGRGEMNFYVGAGNAAPGGFDFIKIIGLAVANGSYVSNVATIASSGSTYNNDTGIVTLTTTATHGIAVGATIGVLNVTGTLTTGSPPVAGNIGVFNDAYSVTAVPTGTTLTFQGPIGQGTATITGGTVGTAVVTLTTKTPHGLVAGTRFNLSLCLGTDFTGPVGNLGDIGNLNGNWIASADNAGTPVFVPVSAAGNSYTTATGQVIINTTAPHNILANDLFTLQNIAGTGTSLSSLNGTWPASSVTSTQITFFAPPGLGTITITGGSVGGVTINFVLTSTTIVPGSAVPVTGLDIVSITAGAINVTEMDSGVIDQSAGLPVAVSNAGTLGLNSGGQLFGVDGYGNARIAGTLVHGAMQSQVVSTGQTLTILPNRSFVHVQNAGSIAALTIAMPTLSLNTYQATGSELEINFDNPVGTITWSGTAPSGAPASITTAHNSIQFIRDSGTWYRRIMA